MKNAIVKLQILCLMFIIIGIMQVFAEPSETSYDFDGGANEAKSQLDSSSQVYSIELTEKKDINGFVNKIINFFVRAASNLNERNTLFSGPENSSLDSQADNFKQKPQKAEKPGTDDEVLSNRSNSSIDVEIGPENQIIIEDIPELEIASGFPFNYQVNVKDNKLSLNYSLIGDVPEFVTINAENGLLSIKPSKTDDGQYNFYVFVEDKFGNNNTANVSLQVIRCSDLDNDGFSIEGNICGAVDCNDNNSSVFIGAKEMPNSEDDNCNTVIDEGLIVGNLSYKFNENSTEYKINVDCNNDICKDKIDVKIECSNHTDIEMSWNANSGALNISGLKIIENEYAGKGSMIVQGLNSDEKTLYVDRVAGYDSICIKDAEIGSAKDISSACDAENEIFLICNNTEINGYACSSVHNNTRYKVEGLRHSGVIEQRQFSPQQSGSSKSSNSKSKIIPFIINNSSANVSDANNSDLIKNLTSSHTNISQNISTITDSNESEDCSSWSECVDFYQTRVCAVGEFTRTDARRCSIINSVESVHGEQDEVNEYSVINVSESAKKEKHAFNISQMVQSFDAKKFFEPKSIILSFILVIIVAIGVIAGYLSFKEK